MVSERDIIRTPSDNFGSEGYKQFSSGFWVKQSAQGVEIRVGCGHCRTIVQHRPLQQLVEGSEHEFVCGLCGTTMRVKLPESKKTIKIVESPETRKAYDGIQSITGGV